MTNPKVDALFENLTQWNAEMRELRNLILDCGLVEELKWGCPCYTFNKNNVVLIHGFKSYCAISFFKGSLLLDEKKMLIAPTENTQAGRQWRFSNVPSIISNKSIIKSYIFEAIEVEKAGIKVEMKKTEAFEVPDEFQAVMQQDSEFKAAFESLTPGRQRGYLLHFAQAKQSATRISRIEQSRKRVMMGKGITDCICGLSKRMPGCDGSHKLLR